jgi:AraC-like DNA-binding protein
MMIDIQKVRRWSVYFSRAQTLDSLPYPHTVAEEVEGPGYKMPQYPSMNIPPEVGGQITLTLSGCGTLSVGGKSYDLLPDTAFLYRDCDQSVSYFFPENGKEPWRFVWINFMGKASEKLIAEINRNYGYFFDMNGDDSLKKQLLSYKEFSGAMLFQTPLEGAKLVFDILNLLCRHTEQRIILQKRTRLVQEVQSEISKAYDESLSTNSIARKLGVSREHLSKTFKAETGCTLQEYRSKCRLLEALNLLMKSNLSCKEIAQSCHYGSYSSFFRAFVKAYKLSPESFRKKRKFYK